MSETAEDDFRTFGKLKSDRGPWETHWDEIAEVVLPRMHGFSETSTTKGEKKNRKIFDSKPVIGLERFAAVMDSMLTPRQAQWHNLISTNPDLNKDQGVKEYFYEVRRRLFAARYAPKANFASQNFERWMSLGAFGTGDMYIDFDPKTGLRYKTLHLKDCFLMENHQGAIDTHYRPLMYTPRQAVQRWGEDRMPESLLKLYENIDSRNTPVEFLHVVRPRKDFDENRLDFKGLPFESLYYYSKEKTLISESGYRTWPFSLSRYVTAPGETYGRGPAMSALPDIKMLNEMSKSDIVAIHRALKPPLLIGDDGVLGGGGMKVSMLPNSLIHGGLDRRGNPTVQPLDTGARIDVADTKMDQRRKSIDDAFLVTLFQILVENPRMTATEALIRAQEKGMLLTPTMGRQTSEGLGPQIERELDLLNSNGMLPDMPPLLLEAEGEYEITYDSPMSRMQRAEELVGVQRSLEILAPLADRNPDILDVINTDELAQLTLEVSGVPLPIINSPEAVEAIRAKRAEAEQTQQMIEAAQPVAGALKDAAQAQQIATG